MIRQKFVKPQAFAALLCLTGIAPATATTISDFNNWNQFQHPAHVGMTGVVDSASQITLTASGPVPAGTDIGYHSVDGITTANSTSGFYFSATQDFSIAVDFSVASASSIGLAAIGFGVGEDDQGSNVAGAVLGILNGTVRGFSAGARTNGVTNIALPPIFTPSLSSGRLFVSYESITGDIIAGLSGVVGSAAPTATVTLSGQQNSWNDQDLLVSLFLRSDGIIFPPFNVPPLQAGTLTTVLSDFEVLAGTPVSAVPLPAAAWLFGAALIGFAILTRRSDYAG
ncbi:MAG: VPLPA-CTERM sorting domain-containing protein [Chromatiaceae bacterium]|nr:VPLPA-CTERM sorting domain-containing protein [Chromatiaceae bacterium]